MNQQASILASERSDENQVLRYRDMSHIESIIIQELMNHITTKTNGDMKWILA